MMHVSGDLAVTIVGHGGKLPVDITHDEENMRYYCLYTPDKAGPVLITVKYAGNEVSGVGEGGWCLGG